MKATTIAAAAVCLLIARAPPAKADVTYRWSDPDFSMPYTDSSITVTDAAYRSGALDFDSYCDAQTVCAPFAGWVSGFEFPAYESAARVDLVFAGNLLSGSFHISLNSDQGWTFEGDGMSWTCAFINVIDTYTETGFYQRVSDPPPDQVPEPVSIAELLAGLAGVAIVQQKRRRVPDSAQARPTSDD